jgi:hypothetical protein
MVVLWKTHDFFQEKIWNNGGFVEKTRFFPGKIWETGVFFKYRKHENLMVEGQRDPLVIMAVENNH